MGLQDGKNHRQPVLVPTIHRAPRRAERGRSHQRLDFDQQRAAAFDAGENRRAGRAEIAFGEKQFGGIGNLAQPGAAHLEHADLVGGTEAVLDRPQDTKLMRAFAFKREDRIHHMLDDAWSGDLAILGHVADEDHGGARALGEPDQRLRARADLSDGTGSGLDQIGPHCLNGIDDDETRDHPFSERRHDVLDRGLGRQLDLGAGKAEPLGTQPHLRHRLFAGDVDRALPAAGERGRDLDQQRGLADAGVAAEQQYRAAHEAAACDAVEFGETRGEPRRVVACAGERRERKEPPLARRACGHL